MFTYCENSKNFYVLSQLQYRNENQNFISNSTLQFINKMK